jgi:hypothetical protein
MQTCSTRLPGISITYKIKYLAVQARGVEIKQQDEKVNYFASRYE